MVTCVAKLYITSNTMKMYIYSNMIHNYDYYSYMSNKYMCKKLNITALIGLLRVNLHKSQRLRIYPIQTLYTHLCVVLQIHIIFCSALIIYVSECIVIYTCLSSVVLPMFE